MAKTYFVLNLCYGRKVDVVLLDDTGVQTVEVHDENELIPKPSFWFEYETTLVLVFGLSSASLFAGTRILWIEFLCFSLGSGSSIPFVPAFVWADVLQFVEFMKQDVLVPFRTTAGQGSSPNT